jgi:hypothetical protein
MPTVRDTLVSSIFPSFLVAGVFSGLVACGGPAPGPASTSDTLSTGDDPGDKSSATQATPKFGAKSAPAPAPRPTPAPSSSPSSGPSGSAPPGGPSSSSSGSNGKGDTSDGKADDGGQTGADKYIGCFTTCMSVTATAKKYFDTVLQCLDQCDLSDQPCKDACFDDSCNADANSCEKFNACNDTCVQLCDSTCGGSGS